MLGSVLTTYYFIYVLTLCKYVLVSIWGCMCVIVFLPPCTINLHVCVCVCTITGFFLSALQRGNASRALRLTEPAFIFTQKQTQQLCWGFASRSSQSLCSQQNAVTGYRYHFLCSLTENLHPLHNFSDNLQKKATNLFNWQYLYSKLLLGQVFCGISIFDSIGFTQMKRDTCILKKCP